MKNARGFTLAELLAAMAVVGLLMAGVVSVLAAGLASYRLGSARVDLQQGLRGALERMGRELREAGYDPTLARFAAIVVAEPGRVAFQRDLNGNGVIDPTRERVTFLLRADGVLRRDAGGGAQPLLAGVRRFALTYHARDHAPTTDPDRVALVRIELEAEAAGVRAVMQTEVALRNVWRPVIGGVAASAPW